MRVLTVSAAALLLGCAATSTDARAKNPTPPPTAPIATVPPASPDRPRTGEAGTPTPAPPAPAVQEENVQLVGPRVQGGLLFGRVRPGAKVTLDGAPVMVDAAGRFALGFGRDSAATAVLKITFPDGHSRQIPLSIARREFPTQRIDGLDQSKVSGFTPEQLKKIAADGALKKAARATTTPEALFADGFAWPATGPISGVFGSQRILNGEAKTPHSGLDIAAPAGTPIRAPAPGVVRLAERDMYFEGGLVLLDHGLWVESAFLHMSRIDVKPGQRVAKGDVLGAVGGTGRATGPHLHWSMRWTDRLVDPQLLLDPAGNPQPKTAAK